MVLQGDRPIGSTRKEFVLLAHNQWVHDPLAEDNNLCQLVAFVRPNDPAVREVLNKASDLLLNRTGSGSLQGYQSGSDRVQLIAHAIYDALASYEWDYSNPPASDDFSGQKVRTHREVLDDRVATCLDSAVLFAACLEASGINPVIWIPEGHAFVGWWNAPVMQRPAFAVPISD
jgi:hypothetical protein